MNTKQIPTIIVLALSFLIQPTFACQKVDDWEKRHNAYQPPDKVMDAIGVEPGMVVGEIGAGRGRYAVHLARRVGETGKIYANDIDEHSLAYLKRRSKRDGINNIETVLGKVADPRFPPSQLDIAFIINTYHHFNEPVAIMKNTVPALKPGGILAIVEHDPEKMGPGYERSTTSKEVLIKQAKEAGYELVNVGTFLERDNIYIFRSSGPRK
jgi:ubiquinone/menaquinone biosynthesis C-methylase UbiE